METAQTILHHLLESGIESDLQIVHGDDTYHVHKAIICRHEGALKANSGWPTDETKGHITIFRMAYPESTESDDDCDDPFAIRGMINFMYAQPFNHIAVSAPQSAPIYFTNLVKLADKYCIANLRAAAIEEFKKSIDGTNFLNGEDIAGLVRFIYKSVPVPELKTAVCNFVIAHAECEEYKEVQELFGDETEFAMDLLRRRREGQ